MSDLISRSNLMTTLNIKEDCHDCAYGASVFCTRGSDFVDACEAIMDAPSIDALEVVRCKDCKCKDKYENFCWMLLREIDPSDYCSYAERKE